MRVTSDPRCLSIVGWWWERLGPVIQQRLEICPNAVGVEVERALDPIDFRRQFDVDFERVHHPLNMLKKALIMVISTISASLNCAARRSYTSSRERAVLSVTCSAHSIAARSRSVNRSDSRYSLLPIASI